MHRKPNMGPEEFSIWFWSVVDRSGGETACWPWTRSCIKRGYGQVSMEKAMWLTHRLAWTLTNGAIPDGLLVLHDCDNPPCCNPKHHFLGTYQDNSDDMVSKDRQAQGDQHGSRLHPESRPRGDNHPSRVYPWLRPRGDENPSRKRPERLARGLRNGAYTQPESVRKGMKNGRAKLTDEDIRAIRDASRSGVERKALAQNYGVGTSTISRIVNRTGWKSVS